MRFKGRGDSTKEFPNEFGFVINAHFEIDILDVCFDGTFTDVQSLRYQSIGVTL